MENSNSIDLVQAGGETQSESLNENGNIMPLSVTAKGKTFGVNVSLTKSSALTNSKGSYPNILYFATDEDCIIFNGKEYSIKAPFYINYINPSSLPADTTLATVLGGPPSAIKDAAENGRPIYMKNNNNIIPVSFYTSGSFISLRWIYPALATTTLKLVAITVTYNNSADTYNKIVYHSTYTLNADA